MSEALAAPEATPTMREEIARLAALHGLGRIDGLGNRAPPNERWTQGEWERRILECVPGAVELQCYALADEILKLVSPNYAERTGVGEALLSSVLLEVLIKARGAMAYATTVASPYESGGAMVIFDAAEWADFQEAQLAATAAVAQAEARS